jgi:hypothetical protein
LKTKKRKLVISHSNLSDLIAQFLVAVSAIPDDEDITKIDIPGLTDQINITVHSRSNAT